MTPFDLPYRAATALLAAALAACSPAREGPVVEGPLTLPDSTRFQQIVLVEGTLEEPTEMDIARDGRVFIAERRGAIKLYDPSTGEARIVTRLDVYREEENGLIGLTLDPSFERNGWLYLTYSTSEPLRHRVSRFTFADGELTDEKVMLEVPFDAGCCHTGGSMTFDGRGNLLVSFGDNTNPFDAGSYAPIDPTPGRELMDARRTSANSQVLRGKILRITPQPDGSYTIPQGNLFSDREVGRPEIYTMGHRNPYRLSVDPHTGYLYWGDVGPDARSDSILGPKGHDEINQARGPGNFGWPMFIADNKPYLEYNFTTGELGDHFDPENPINTSPNNTGVERLPPAQPAFIWYSYDPSTEFPLVGDGGRTAMAGPVYHYDDFAGSEVRLPRYYDGTLIIYEWMRNWMRAVWMDGEGDYVRMEPLFEHLDFARPVDMQLGPDGALYVLEYGTYWFSGNPDSRLSRIVHHPGNRPPVARVSVSRSVGAAPLTVELSAGGSVEHDVDDPLRYEWTIGDERASGETITHTFTEPGTYRVRLVASDASGASSAATTEIRVGNEPPEVEIALDGNRSFYWDAGPVEYRVRVRDAEDGALGRGIDPEQVRVTLDYLPEGLADALATGHQTNARPAGLALIEASDCMGCHTMDQSSIGPSFREIAQRYASAPDTMSYLVRKVTEGGGGAWGERVMPAHPGLSEDVAEEMARYILSLAAPGAPLPVAGTLPLDQHAPGADGAYVLTAAYVDQARNGIGPLHEGAEVVLRAPLIPLPEAVVRMAGDHLALGRLDLSGVSRLGLRVQSLGQPAAVELRAGGPGGALLGSAAVPAVMDGWHTVEIPVSAAGEHDLHLVFRSEAAGPETPLLRIQRVSFEPHSPPGASPRR